MWSSPYSRGQGERRNRGGQFILIAGNIVVKVVRVDGDQVKLGIDAPKEVSVHREEIQRQKDAGVPAPGGASEVRAG